MEKTAKDEKKKKGGNLWSWLLWWNLDKNEIQAQADTYNSLKITQSARGISFLLLIFSAVVTVIFILFLNWDSSALFDAIAFLVLGYFIYKGHKWAMLGAMALWTYDKLFILFQQYETASATGGSTPNPIITLIWWATYMHAFWLAFQVERLRSKTKKAAALNQSTSKHNLDDLEKLADLKSKGIITEEDFNKKKSEILGI